MPTPLSDLTSLQGYTIPALKRALHHAKNVADIVPAVLGNIMLYAVPDSLNGRGNGNSTGGNMGWITSAATGRSYAVVYSHKSQSIEIRDRNQQGRVLHSFTNATPNRDLISVFASL